MFEKVLVANRGEIAIRIMRTLEEMGIASVGVYSDLDRDALHVKRADEAYLLGPGPAPESYLKIDKILEVATRPAPRPCTRATASWPRTPPSRALRRGGNRRSSARPDAIEAMGSKTQARELMRKAGVPIVPGTTEPVETIDDVRKVIADEIGYPVAVKAAAGGGGKGFRVALERVRGRGRVRGRRARGREVLRRRHRLPRALPRPTRATSRSRCWPTATGTSSTWASATAPCSADTRS